MTLDELLQAPALDVLLLQMYGPRLVASYPSVVVSQWTKYYFMCFWQSVLNAWPESSARWESVRISVDPRGLPSAIELGLPGHDETLDELIEFNLRPLIRRFAKFAKLPAGVFWSNAGDALEQALQSASGRREQTLWRQRRLASGARNPLHGTVRYLPDGIRKVRICCRAWQVPGVGHCEHCPLTK